MVNVAKRKARWRWGRQLTEAFVRDSRSFRRDMRKAWSEKKMRVLTIKDKNGQVTAKDVKVSERFKEYFEELLNFEEEREAIVLAIRGRGEMPLLGDLNDRSIGKDGIEDALGDLKVGKTPGLDGIAPELLKYGGK